MPYTLLMSLGFTPTPNHFSSRCLSFCWCTERLAAHWARVMACFTVSMALTTISWFRLSAMFSSL